MNRSALQIEQMLCDYNLTQAELSRKLNIPIRTIEDWKSCRRTPPDYVLNMMWTILKLDKQEAQPQEKTLFCVYSESFEFRTKPDAHYSEQDIIDKFNEQRDHDPTCIGRFATLEEARAHLAAPYSSTFEHHNMLYVSAEVSYIAEELYSVNDDGEESFTEELGWSDVVAAPIDC